MNWFERWASSQLASCKGVSVEYRWDEVRKQLCINSEAGTIIFRPKTITDLNTFRNHFLNKIVEVSTRPDKRKEIFKIYREAKARKGVRIKANARTRFEGLLWNLMG